MRAHRINIYMLLSIALAAAIFAGCNGSSNPTMASGAMTLSVSDTPVDGATSVVVSFTGVEIQPAGKGSDDHGDDDCNEGAPPPGTTVAPPTTTSQPSMGDDDQGDDEGDENCAPAAGTTTA